MPRKSPSKTSQLEPRRRGRPPKNSGPHATRSKSGRSSKTAGSPASTALKKAGDEIPTQRKAVVLIPEDVKRFIVECLAWGDTPHEVSKAVEAEFEEVRVTPQICQRYNPERQSGCNLSKPLRDLFYEVRERKKAALLAESDQGSRIAALVEMAKFNQKRGAHLLAAKLWEQVAKESGGYFERQAKAAPTTAEVTGDNGNPSLISGRWDLSKLSYAELEMVAALSAKCDVALAPALADKAS